MIRLHIGRDRARIEHTLNMGCCRAAGNQGEFGGVEARPNADDVNLSLARVLQCVFGVRRGGKRRAGGQPHRAARRHAKNVAITRRAHPRRHDGVGFRLCQANVLGVAAGEHDDDRLDIRTEPLGCSHNVGSEDIQPGPGEGPSSLYNGTASPHAMRQKAVRKRRWRTSWPVGSYERGCSHCRQHARDVEAYHTSKPNRAGDMWLRTSSLAK